jgi:GT2 family glycosyltransferase
MEKVRASIVVYKTDPKLLTQAMESFLMSSIAGLLTIIDNSPTDCLRSVCTPQVEYIFNNRNLGYGRAHNIAMQKSIGEAQYHIVLNPDVQFNPIVVEKLFRFMESEPEAGLAMPRVLDPEGRNQMMCKLLPAPWDLITRRFFPFESWFSKMNDRYEMKDSGYDQVMDVPFLSGCFMFLRTSALKEVGLFDERFFLYAEDTDLSRRIHQKFETLFYPEVSISHVHARGSYKNLRLTVSNAVSAIQYFNKWGWFFDSERQKINQLAMNSAVAQIKNPVLSEVRAA